ncbi:hypothetical protein Lal_00049342 [Lupinus albus]|nr:hypothetical protein Lal_00049342 [Lupinus albus]
MGPPKCLNVFIALCSLSMICNNCVDAFHAIHPNLQSFSVHSVDTLHRTGFHFQPPRNWINGFPNNPFTILTFVILCHANSFSLYDNYEIVMGVQHVH